MAIATSAQYPQPLSAPTIPTATDTMRATISFTDTAVKHMARLSRASGTTEVLATKIVADISHRDRNDPRVAIEPGQQRSRRREHQRQKNTCADIDPKQIARQGMVQALALHDRFGVAVNPKAHKQQAERRHHRHQSKIGGPEQSCQYSGRNHLDSERERLGSYRDSGTAHGELAQLAFPPNGQKLASRIKWLQKQSPFFGKTGAGKN